MIDKCEFLAIARKTSLTPHVVEKALFGTASACQVSRTPSCTVLPTLRSPHDQRELWAASSASRSVPKGRIRGHERKTRHAGELCREGFLGLPCHRCPLQSLAGGSSMAAVQGRCDALQGIRALPSLLRRHRSVCLSRGAGFRRSRTPSAPMASRTNNARHCSTS